MQQHWMQLKKTFTERLNLIKHGYWITCLLTTQVIYAATSYYSKKSTTDSNTVKKCVKYWVIFPIFDPNL